MHGGQILLDGRRIGWITSTADGKRIFKSPRRRIPHFFRIFSGWGLSEQWLQYLEKNNFEEIHLQISDRETLVSQLKDWRIHGIPYQKSPFEEQIILPEKYFTKHMLSLSQLDIRPPP